MDIGKLQAVVDQLSADIDKSEVELRFLLDKGIDGLASGLDGPKKAGPYALAAYALSSVIFAYLRSEGRDTAIVSPELVRIRERLGRLTSIDASQSPQISRTSETLKESSRGPSVEPESSAQAENVHPGPSIKPQVSNAKVSKKKKPRSKRRDISR